MLICLSQKSGYETKNKQKNKKQKQKKKKGVADIVKWDVKEPHPGSSSLGSTGLHGVDLLVVLHVRYLRHGPQHVPQSLGANGTHAGK